MENQRQQEEQKVQTQGPLCNNANVIPPTDVLYMNSYDGNFLTTCKGTILSITTNESNDTIIVVVNQTVLYSQGGGQPSDHGTIQFVIPTTTTTATTTTGSSTDSNNVEFLSSLSISENTTATAIAATTTISSNEQQQQQQQQQQVDYDVTIFINKVWTDRETGIVYHSGHLSNVQITKRTNERNNDDNKNNDIIEDSDSKLINENSTNDSIASTVNSLLLLLLHNVTYPIYNVTITVNKQLRSLHSECHTVGHIIDAAVLRCNLSFKVGKAYHFLDGPYVEYSGTLDSTTSTSTSTTTTSTTVLQQLQQAYTDIINESMETKIQLLSIDDAISLLCNTNNDNKYNTGNSSNDNNIDDNEYNSTTISMYANPISKLVRIVTIANIPCPCGGTHIANTNQLHSWYIIGIKVFTKKGIVRIKYGQKKEVQVQ